MKRKKARLIFGSLLIACTLFSACFYALLAEPFMLTGKTAGEKAADTGKPIKWVEFNIPYEVMKRAMDIDVDTYNEKVHVNWTDTLAYLGAKYGGEFTGYSHVHMDDFVSRVKGGASVASITKDMKYFKYYSKAYGAVLGGMLGEYQIKIPSEKGGAPSWKKVYGLKSYSPVAEGFYYSDFDDFGENRSYGYSRRHLGHDMMTQTGAPVIAVESGTVEALGWNQYGGWRIGIRSYDTLRYYYYAHLRKDNPFADNLYIGANVTAGDVIGYTGQTGYSIKENVNNIDTPHLHYGLQLVFDEDAKDSPTQIWINLYGITKLLESHKCSVTRDDATGMYHRKYPFSEGNYYLNEKEANAQVTHADEIPLPIIMYHGLLKDPARQNKYVISPGLFEKDLIYLKKHGYTPVFMKEVIAYAEGSGELPKKPVVITFDDGYYNNYYYAFPLLKKYDMKAVISVVGKMSEHYSQHPDDNPNYSHITWDHILDMHLSGRWEIQNHSYNCHSYESRNGVAQTSAESITDYKKFLKSDIGRLQDKIAYVTGVAPNTFTYPFGAFNDNTDAVLKEIGFKATLSCTEGVSTIKRGDTSGLYKLKRHLRPSGKTSEDFFTFLR